jgi:hypothetical protein
MNDSMKRITIAVLGLTLAVGAMAARAGVYVETVDRNLTTGTTGPAQKMYVQGGNGRFVDGEGLVTIIRNGTLTMIDDRKKTYSNFDKATMEKLGKSVTAAMEQMKEQLAQLPPEQRAQVEQMLNAKMPGMAGGGKQWTVEAQDTGRTDTVDGRKCRLWDIKRNGELDEQLCVVPFSALPGKENFQEVFASFARVFEEMAKSVPMLTGIMSTEFDAQTKVNGFPVRTRPYENGKLAPEEQVMRVWREEAIPAAMFEVPAGYRKEDPALGGE